MAITFTNDRYFRTDVGSKIFQNVPRASQWFKIKVVSKSVMLGQTGFLSKIIFDFFHQFMGLGTDTTMPLRFVMTSSTNAFSQVDLSLTLNVVYGVAVVWDGIAGSQKVWISGDPAVMSPSFTGNTRNDSSAMQAGVGNATARVVFTLDDINCWSNYLLTQADITALLEGADPTTIGTGATPKQRWTLAGTPGVTAAIGQAGLKNAYGGGGSLASGGDGTDFITAGGAGTAVYAPGLVWSPTVSATPYVATSGQVVVMRPFTSLTGGAVTTPTRVISVPAMNLNGTDLGFLGLGPSGWFPGGMPFLWFTTPGSIQVNPGDIVKLTAPSAWCNTPAGSVAALDGSVAIDNRTGRSSFGTDTLEKTLLIGSNNPQAPMSVNLQFYPVFKNQKQKWGTPGNRGRVTTNFSGEIFYQPIYNAIDSNTYPGPVGKFLAMWDDPVPAAPNVGNWSTFQTSLTTVSGKTSGLGTLSGGKLIGSWTYADFGHVSPTGSATLSIAFGMSRTGGPNYENLALVYPGDWELVAGVPVFDRSDPWALSNTYLARVPHNVGSLRWVDAGPVGPDPRWCSRARNLQKLSDENWSSNCAQVTTVAFSTFGPVNTTTTPWLYSEHFGKPGNQGNTFTATLAAAVTTAPPQETLETWTFSDGATAPLLAGLEVLIDNEFVNLERMGADATQWVVWRGSNGTTPAPHAAGPVTVYGRFPITSAIHADGTSPGSDLVGFTSATAHGLTSFEIMQTIVSSPNITLTNGDVVKFTGAAVFVTGPNTGFMIQAPRVQGTTGVPVGTTSAGSCTFKNQFPVNAASMPHEAQAIATAQFDNADYHLNIHQSACDEYIWSLARRLKLCVAEGRKVYVEYSNEIWNQFFGIFGWLVGYAGGYIFRSADQTGYGVKRAVEAADIFRSVWGDRAAEIMTVLNCQVGGDDVKRHLDLATANGWQIDRVMQAPYMDMATSAYNITVFNGLSDAQGIDMFLHDLYCNPNNLLGPLAKTRAQIAAYNAATGHNCIMMAYEGGVEMPLPLLDHNQGNPNNPLRWSERVHDMITHPNWYLAELDTYAFLQSQGFDRAHIYAMLGMFWNPQTWGGYHGVQQEPGRGDGSDGKFNNMLCRANPTLPGYKGASVNQDGKTVSVRGQAFIDWLGAVGSLPAPPEPDEFTEWLGTGFRRWFRNKQGDTEMAAGGTPHAPESLSATAVSSTRIDLSWTPAGAGPPASSFEIHKSLDGFIWSNLATVAATSYSNTGLTAGTRYYYRTRATNNKGSSAWSGIATAATAGAGVVRSVSASTSYSGAAASSSSIAGTGTSYYMAPSPGSGAGTIGSPFGLADLTTGTSPVAPGAALQALHPGDTLYFRGGTYHIAGDGTHYQNQILCPTVSGTAPAPITIRNYPGETVNIVVDSGIQPAMGSQTPVVNYVRFLGFKISGLTTFPAFYLGGTGCEIGYCEAVGQFANTPDNHDGIRIDNADSAWVHHNNVHGVDGDPANHNSAQIKMYFSTNCIIEDNYLHDGQVGIFDKAVGPASGGGLNTFRRNHITRCYDSSFLGNNDNFLDGTHPALDFLYDNVIDNNFSGSPNGQPINLYNLSRGNQVYNNLIFAGNSGGFGRAIGDGEQQYNPLIWNNIMLFGALANPLSYSSNDQPIPPGPTSSLLFMNNNVYDVSPGYWFAGTTRSLSYMQSNGFEGNAHVDTAANIFVDQVAYVLKTFYQTAGVASSTDSTPVCVGPGRSTPSVGGSGVITVAQIRDSTRYGPSAIGSYT